MPVIRDKGAGKTVETEIKTLLPEERFAARGTFYQFIFCTEAHKCKLLDAIFVGTVEVIALLQPSILERFYMSIGKYGIAAFRVTERKSFSIIPCHSAGGGTSVIPEDGFNVVGFHSPVG